MASSGVAEASPAPLRVIVSRPRAPRPPRPAARLAHAPRPLQLAHARVDGLADSRRPQQAASRPPSARAPTSLPEASASTDRPESPLKRRSRARAARPQRPQPTTPTVTVVDVFSPGMLRSPVFRIPALLALPDGSVLAFSEARPELHDAGIIDLVLRRSADNGRTWGPAQIIVDGAALGMARSATVGNPAPCYDASTDTIHLLLCSNHQHDAEWQIHAREGKDTRRVWVTSSKDGGRASAPREITRAVWPPGWTWYATGPAPASSSAGAPPRAVQPRRGRRRARPPVPGGAAALADGGARRHSDDRGATWRLGGVGPIAPTRRRSPSSPTAR